MISSLQRKHRATEFRKFLAKINSQGSRGSERPSDLRPLPDSQDPRAKKWLQNPPRFHIHITPTYSSWLNQVEWFFGFVTQALVRRGVQALEADIRKWVKGWNESPEPFIWTEAAEQTSNRLADL